MKWNARNKTTGCAVGLYFDTMRPPDGHKMNEVQRAYVSKIYLISQE